MKNKVFAENLRSNIIFTMVVEVHGIVPKGRFELGLYEPIYMRTGSCTFSVCGVTFAIAVPLCGVTSGSVG